MSKGGELINKILKIILISVLSIIIIFGGFISWFIYETEYKATTISQYTSPNNNYKLLFQSIGEPLLFGPTDVRLILLNNKGEEIGAVLESIYDDGGTANKNNIKVKWLDSYVEFTLSGCEQLDETSKIDYQ